MNIDSKKKGKNDTIDEKLPHHGRRSTKQKHILMFQGASNCFEETFMLINLLFLKKCKELIFNFSKKLMNPFMLLNLEQQ